MTEQDAASLPAGSDTDREVARELMEWTQADTGNVACDPKGVFRLIPAYTTDPAARWELQNALIDAGYLVHITDKAPHVARIAPDSDAGPENIVACRADTPELALARAALKYRQEHRP